MKYFYYFFFLVTTYTFGQCNSSTENSASPVSVNNDGSVSPLIALVGGEYTIVNNLTINNEYQITVDQDLIAPVSEAHVTLRRTADNSVISFGNTPLTFTADETSLQLHFFDEANCLPVFDLVILAAQNLTTLNSDDYFVSTSSIFYNKNNRNIEVNFNNLQETDFKLIEISGKIISQELLTEQVNFIDTSSLPTGLYFIQLKSNDGNIKLQKILIW